MNVNMNGLRINVANAYNEFCREMEPFDNLSSDQAEKLDNLRCAIGGLLAVYIPEDDQFADLSEKISLIDPLKEMGLLE